MRLNLNILPNTINEASLFYNNAMADNPLFACVDKGSYIINSTIECRDDSVVSLNIGRFCAIAHDVRFIMDLNHDFKSVALGESDLFCFDRNKMNIKRKTQIIIQNDVWIGRGATIMSGVTLNNGAVVTANAHVVKDVPPYAIVGGNPAKVIGYRFDNDVIRKMQDISWWYWDDENIKNNSIYFKDDINKFCDMFYDGTENDKKIEELEELDYRNRYLYFMDFSTDFFDKNSVWSKITDEFVGTRREDDLLLFYINNEDYIKNKDYVDQLSEEIDRLIELNNKKCAISFYIGDKENEKYIFKYINYFITNKGIDTVEHSCYAYENNVRIVSGIDIPVFI